MFRNFTENKTKNTGVTKSSKKNANFITFHQKSKSNNEFKSNILGEKYIKKRFYIQFIDSGVIYTNRELDELKKIKSNESKKFLHEAKKIFEGHSLKEIEPWKS